jgi:phosphoribosylaminoimidazole-succinocarboxamide synthase
MNVSFDEAARLVGRDVMTAIRDRSIALYQRAAEYARERGVIIADTKFEWGRVGGDLILIDEVLTPDSSRFWPADQYQPGRDQASFDKQFVRDWLESIKFNKQPPGPALPDDVVAKTSAKYLEAYERLTGHKLA